MYEKPGAEWSREQQTKGWSMMNAFLPANILIPQVDSMEKWAVIACDQFTSDPAYWARVAEIVGNAPSTLRLILPEAELGDAPGGGPYGANQPDDGGLPGERPVPDV